MREIGSLRRGRTVTFLTYEGILEQYEADVGRPDQPCGLASTDDAESICWTAK